MPKIIQEQKIKPKIIFFGTPEFAALILEGLIKNGYKPALVITVQDKPVGRKKIITPPPVKILAIKYNIPVLQPEVLANSGIEFPFMEAKVEKRTKFSLTSEILKFKPDLIILAAYGQILPKEILDIPKYGSINVHPSLLPRWRGPSPIQSAILANDQKTGVSIIKMTEKVDKGPILGQKEIGLTGKETYLDLHNRLGEMGSNLLIEIIQKWIKDEIKPEPQDDSKAVYSKIIKKEDGKIDWEKPAEEIERKIRALNPWPGTYTIQQGKILKILKVEISNGKLIIKEIQPEGKKPMSFEDFLRGYPDFKHPS